MKENKNKQAEDDFALIMRTEKPETILDLFGEDEKDIPLSFLVKGGTLENMTLTIDEESLLNGILVAYPQGPPDGNVEEYKKYATLVLKRISQLRGYEDMHDLITDQTVKLFDEFGETAAQMAMITAGMIKKNSE